MTILQKVFITVWKANISMCHTNLIHHKRVSLKDIILYRNWQFKPKLFLSVMTDSGTWDLLFLIFTTIKESINLITLNYIFMVKH